MNFDLNNITIEDYEKISDAKQEAIEKYLAKGYTLPTYSVSLIKDVYNQIFQKETNRAYREDKDGVSDKVSEKMTFLRDLTEIKLYNTLLSSFKTGEESVELSFYRGIPDKSTAEFFNLEDVSGSDLNFTRTSSVRLPKSFGTPRDCTFVMTPQGDGVSIDGKDYGILDPVLQESDMAFIVNEPTE